MRTETSMPFIASLIMFEMRMGPPSANSMPLMSETMTADSGMNGFQCETLARTTCDGIASTT